MVRTKIIHYRRLYADRPDPVVFMPLVVNTSGRLYDDFLRLHFLHTHPEASALTGVLPHASRGYCFDQRNLTSSDFFALPA